MNERALRKAICRAGKRLVRRGLVHGTAGNISVRAGDALLLTPTGSALDALDPDALSLLSATGDHLGGTPPTKEWRLHRAMYDARPGAAAVVHTHSTYCVAVSLLADADPADLLPPLTPYYLMRIGRCPRSPYRPPGDAALADDVAALARDHHALILAHHGPVVAGTSLDDAVAILEELEETARLYFLVRDAHFTTLDAPAIADLRERYPMENR